MATSLPSMSHHRQPALPTSLVIIVDEDEAVLGSLKLALEIDGFKVRTYSSWNGVFEDADFDDCVCLITDQKLPGFDGLGLVAALRTRRVAAPVVLISSDPTVVQRERAAKAGVPIIEKNLLGHELLDHIRDVIARQKSTH